ncbi:MAG: YchJ family metal-binding protein [Mariprofundaceae bacterium]
MDASGGMNHAQPCKCGSGASLGDCCGRWLDTDANAATAASLMRSRYTAYVLGRRDYLMATWHPETRPQGAELGGMSLRWIGLEIVAAEQGEAHDTQGVVEFIASYVQTPEVQPMRGKRLHEHSRFVRNSNIESGRWLYMDGDCQVSDIKHSDVCPCASGRTFKRCCGAPAACVGG